MVVNKLKKDFIITYQKTLRTSPQTLTSLRFCLVPTRVERKRNPQKGLYQQTDKYLIK